ncbi:MAG: phage major capsid protein [Cytophagales bacterium]|nr:phage major capsid protein [Cytophagales bacterium]
MSKEELELALKEATQKINAKQTELDEANKKALEGKADAAKLKTLEDTVEQLKGDKNELENKFNEALKTIQKVKEKEQKSVIAKFADENLEAVKKAIGSGQKLELSLKADFLTTSVTNSMIAQRDNEISPLAHRRLTMYDIFRKVPVSADQNGTVRYIDWDTDTTARAAAAIAEGGTFPESTAKFIERSISLEKIGDTIPVSEEMLYDGARFAAELQPFLTQNVNLKVDTDLLDGDGSTPNIFGLDTRANAYTASAAGITDASIYDLIVKVKTAITVNKGNKYAPNVAIINSASFDELILKKDADKNYIRPPFVVENGSTFYVNGVMVLVNDNVDTNVMYVGDSNYGRIYESAEGYSITVGEVDAQFTTDMKTIKARKRLNLLIKNSEQDAWRKVSSISAALTTLAS